MARPHHSDRTFGLIFTAVFAVVALIGWFVFGRRLDWAMALAAGFLLTALLYPILLLPLNRLWARFTTFIGLIVNHFLLGLFFFVVMWPFGAVLRMFGWDPMAKGRRSRAPSQWTPVTRGTDAETFRDMF